MSEETAEPGKGPGMLIVAGSFLAIILIAGIVMSVMNLIDSGEKASETMSGPEQTLVIDDHDVPAPSCSLDHESDELPHVRMSAWPSMWEGVRIAVSEDFGPCDLSGVPSQYAHSPIGAALAAMNFVALMNNADDPHAVGSQYGADGPERALLLEGMGEPADGNLSIKGFQYLGSMGDVVAVRVAASGPGAGLITVELVMVWQDDDWKVQPVSDEQLWVIDTAGSVDELRLSGWTIWGF